MPMHLGYPEPRARAPAAPLAGTWEEEVEAGRAYFGGDRTGASVGNTSALELRNPTDSRVRIYVRSVVVAISVAGSIQYRIARGSTLTVAERGRSVKNPEALSVGQIAFDNPAGLVGSAAGATLLAANAPVPLDLGWPIVLEANLGLIFQSNGTNVDLSVMFYWSERPGLER